MFIAFTAGAFSLWGLSVYGADPYAFVLLFGLVYFTWGEIYSLFPATCTDAFGAKRVIAFAREHAPGRRVWAIEGTGSYGSGLTTYLLEQGEWVVEIDRPARPARRNGAKSDELDAVRAAREALSREHLAQPRRRGDREAIRVLVAPRARSSVGHGRSPISTGCRHAPEDPQPAPTDEPRAPARLRTDPASRSSIGDERGAAVAARRALACEARPPISSRPSKHRREVAPASMSRASACWCARLLSLVACGTHWARPHSGWRRRGLIPASSGQTVRHRLNRAGDRQLNRALHTIVLSRLQHDEETRAYAARRLAEARLSRSSAAKAVCRERLFKLEHSAEAA
jgi:hypothetical protein